MSEGEGNHRGGNWLPLLVLAAFLVGLVTLLANDAWQLATFRRVVGEVTKYVPPDKHADKNLQTGRLEFRYTVDGVGYAYHYPPDYRVGMPRLGYPLLRQPHAAGDEIDVYYDPDDPAYSTLQPRIEASPLAFLTFLLPFAILVAGIVRRSKHVKMTRHGNIHALHSATLIAYLILSVVVASAFLFATTGSEIPWPVALAIAAALPTLVVPGLTLLAHRWILARDDDPLRPSFGELRAWHSQVSRRKRIAVLAALNLFWWGILSVFLYGAYEATLQSLLAGSNYVKTTGVVGESRVRELDDGDAEPVVTYRYKVDGRVFDGDRITFGRIRIAMKTPEAQQIVDRYPAGSRVEVHYDPRHPESSVLELELPLMRWLMCLVMLPFIAVGLLLLWMLGRAIRGEKSGQSA